MTWLADSLNFSWPYRTWPDRPLFSSCSAISLLWKASRSFVSLEFSVADNLSLSWACIIYWVSPWWSRLTLSYFPPVSCNLLFSSSFSTLNTWTRCLKSSIYFTNAVVWPTESLNLSWPSLTWPANPIFSSVICCILVLKLSSYRVNRSVSERDSLNFYWPSRIWLANNWLSFCEPSYLMPSYLILFSSNSYLHSNSEVLPLNPSISATNCVTWFTDKRSFSWPSRTWEANYLLSDPKPSSFLLNYSS